MIRETRSYSPYCDDCDRLFSGPVTRGFATKSSAIDAAIIDGAEQRGADLLCPYCARARDDKQLANAEERKQDALNAGQ